MDNKKYFISQLIKIIKEYNSLKKITQHSGLSDKRENVSTLITKTKAAVQRIVGINSEYYKEIIRIQEMKIFDSKKLKPLVGIVIALKDDLENDFLKSAGEIIHSEVFNDFLEMAEHLLNNGYKDASAVISGSTLDAHLRKLCIKNSIPTKITNSKQKLIPKKASVLNSELCKSSIYTMGMEKQITAWLDIRNNAAHGHYSNYTQNEVDLMIKGINNFIVLNPA